MKTIAHSRAKLIRTAIGAPLLAAAGLACLGRVGTFVGAIVLIGTVALVAFGVQASRKLFGDAPALRYDRDRITIATMWSESTVRWSDVAEVGTSALNTYAFYGLIKVGSTQYLDIKMRGGFMARKYRLLSGMFELDKGGFAALLVDLEAHRAAAQGRSTGDVSEPPVARDLTNAPQADIFDPDAALANYLRRRQQGESAVEAPAAAPVFGRRDMLEGAPQPSLTAPRAGGFGRKIA